MLFQGKKKGCDSKPNSKTCTKKHNPRYYYNKFTGKCKKIKHGECGKNKNDYATEKECRSQCENQGIELGGLKNMTSSHFGIFNFIFL